MYQHFLVNRDIPTHLKTRDKVLGKRQGTRSSDKTLIMVL